MPIIILLIVGLALAGCQKTPPQTAPKPTIKTKTKDITPPLKSPPKTPSTQAPTPKVAEPETKLGTKPETKPEQETNVIEETAPFLFVAYFPPNKKINSLKDAREHYAKLTAPQSQVTDSMRLFWKTIHTKGQDITPLLDKNMMTVVTSNALGEEDEADKITKLKVTKGKRHRLSDCENIGPQSLATCSQGCCTFKFFPPDDFEGALHNTVDLTKVCFNMDKATSTYNSAKAEVILPITRIEVSVDQCNAPR